MIQGTNSFGFFGGGFELPAETSNFGVATTASFATTLKEVTKSSESSATNLEAALSALELPNFTGEIELKGDAVKQLETSIKDVSKLLNLDVELNSDLGVFEGEEISDEMIIQLSELLSVLNDLPPLLRGLGKANESVEIAGKMVNPEEATLLAQTLDTEKTKVQLALTTLELGAEVAVNTKDEKNLLGLTVASNPETISKEQTTLLPESFTKLFEEDTEELTDILSRIRKMVTNSAKSDSKDESVKSALSALKVDGNFTETDVVKSETSKAAINLTNSELELASSLDKNTKSNKTTLITKILNENEVEISGIKDEKVTKVAGEEASQILNILKKDGEKKGAQKSVDLTEVNSSDSEKSKLTSNLKNLANDSNSDNSDKGQNSEDEKGELFSEKAEKSGLFSTKPNESIVSSIKPEEVVVSTNETNSDVKVEVSQTDKLFSRPNTAKVFEEQILRQVSNGLAEAAKEGAREITLLLRPESLGKVQITISMENDIVAAKLTVESQQVKQIIESNFDALRNALADHDLSAGSLDVNVSTGGDKEAFASNNGKSGKGFAESNIDEEPIVADLPGTETGRRFGTNSFEYFA
jgi:flagellar hook-length control protein FliK